MPTYVALLRAVNVGGTGKLPMAELKTLCLGLGFASVRTYIASGNVVFEIDQTESKVKAALEAALRDYAGKSVGVAVRSGIEMTAVLAANPFAASPPNQTVAIFLDHPPPDDLLAGVSGQAGEKIAAGAREIYVTYPDGMARSKLKIKAAKAGTARNMNTVAVMAELCRAKA